MLELSAFPIRRVPDCPQGLRVQWPGKRKKKFFFYFIIYFFFLTRLCCCAHLGKVQANALTFYCAIYDQTCGCVYVLVYPQNYLPAFKYQHAIRKFVWNMAITMWNCILSITQIWMVYTVSICWNCAAFTGHQLILHTHSGQEEPTWLSSSNTRRFSIFFSVSTK